MQEGLRHAPFMQDDLPPIPEDDLAERLHLIVDEMLKPFGKTSFRSFNALAPSAASVAPFDISKPNQHDNKSEFLCELKAVEDGMENIRNLVKIFSQREEEPKQSAMLERLSPILDQKMRNNAPGGQIESALQMVRNNAANVGGLNTSLYILLDFWKALRERCLELKDQEGRFWDVSNRPPDHYARAIALRLARLYARETNKRPTIGTSGVSGEPSTGYTRALEKVFAELGMRGRVRTHAEWAVSQLKVEDFGIPKNALSGLLGGAFSAPPSRGILDVVQALEEKSNEE